MKHEHRISKIETGSIAEELGIEPGDVLVSINDNEVEDVFDYHYYVSSNSQTAGKAFEGASRPLNLPRQGALRPAPS